MMRADGSGTFGHFGYGEYGEREADICEHSHGDRIFNEMYITIIRH